MSNEAKNRADGMERGDDEALWRLLGRARTPQAGPYFSRRVLRETARLDEAGTSGGSSWLARWRRQVWRRPGAAIWPGVAAMAVFWLSVELTIPSARTGGAARHVWTQEAPSVSETARAAESTTADGRRDEAAAATAEDGDASQDVEIIADLDNVITREENLLWTEDAARF